MLRVRAELREAGHKVSRKRVARLMRQACIRGVSRRRGFTVTTEPDRRQRPAPDLVNRRFHASEPDQLWVADMTYIPTWTGFLYLAVVVDAFSRKVVGWSMGEHMTAKLVLAALNMVLHTRRPDTVIHHSDQGHRGATARRGAHGRNAGDGRCIRRDLYVPGGCQDLRPQFGWPGVERLHHAETAARLRAWL
jgi:putative transposase